MKIFERDTITQCSYLVMFYFLINIKLYNIYQIKTYMMSVFSIPISMYTHDHWIIYHNKLLTSMRLPRQQLELKIWEWIKLYFKEQTTLE